MLETNDVSASRSRCRWLTGCSIRDMSFSTFIDRARADFVEMPGLELTLPQAVRCGILESTTAGACSTRWRRQGFLTWYTHRRTVIRTRPGAHLSDSSVSWPTLPVPMAIACRDKWRGG